jgi:hypothetical protein
VSLLAVVSITLPIANITNTSIANASPNSIEINSISEVSCTSVEILFESSVPKKSLVNYVITAAVDTSVGQPKNIKKVIKTKATGLITAEIKNLNPKVAYKFSVSAKTNKGKMINSEAVEYYSLCDLMDTLSNLPADWGNPKPTPTPTPTPTTPPIAIPAFTLSSATESRTVNTAATGFTINSTGGAIASFAINATPPGMSFNTTTGALTGTPNTVAAATNYTITATNASGSATQSFGLTVTAVVYTVGQAGPGGGIIFYVASTPFACGPTRAATCNYLEVTPSDWNDDNLFTARSWAQATPVNYQSTTVPGNGATATAIGWGYRNTRAIIAQGNTDTATSAAAFADSHTVTYSGVVYDDWFLPSKEELAQLYSQKVSIDFAEGILWSSSEDGAGFAWNQDFTRDFQSNDYKDFPAYVRPVRAF